MNKVTPEHINKLVETIQFDTHHFEGTNYTVAIAKFPDGFVVANGVSSCVDSSNFNKKLGEQYAIEDAKALRLLINYGNLKDTFFIKIRHKC